MHIAREELRAFSSDSPEHVVLRAIKTLRTRGRPNWRSVLQAIERLEATRGSRRHSAIMLSERIVIAVETFPARTISELHDEVHRLILESEGEAPYVRSFDTNELHQRRHVTNVIVEELLRFFPHRGSAIVVASWYDGRNREIAY